MEAVIAKTAVQTDWYQIHYSYGCLQVAHHTAGVARRLQHIEGQQHVPTTPDCDNSTPQKDLVPV